MTLEEFIRARCPDGINGRIFAMKVLIDPAGVWLYIPSECSHLASSNDPGFMCEVKGDTLIPCAAVAEINPHSVPEGEAA
jgi:hypothetical protein